MTDILCKLLPLFKFTIYYNEDDAEHSYTYIIIADTISGLIDAIADREVEYSMHDSRKYLTVSDFLRMPCEHTHNGYYLFDVDNHDIAMSRGLDIDNEHYVCRFEGNEPKPVTGFERILMYFDKRSEQLKNTSQYYDEILANALYDSCYVDKAITGKHLDEIDREKRDREIGNEALLKLMGGK